jgi:DNA polymerase (family 10)
MLELNSHPQRLDLDSHYLKLCKEAGVKVSIATDAHTQTGFLDMEYGVSVARRAGLTPSDIVNCMDLNSIVALRPRNRS